MAFPSDLSRDRTSPEHMQLKAGQRVFNKRYELKQMLAPGGMGVVWMALDHAVKKNVALKFLPSILVHHEKEMQSLRAQVDVGQQLRHDLIVATYGLEVEAALAAIVLEFVGGQTLKQKLEACERGFFEPQEIDPWLADITSALSYLHEQRALVHRDIKPANIIVTMEGRARLLDFGISQSIQETMGRLTQTGEVQGTSNTLAYASPESLGLRHKAAIADDIYSLGATLYELLTGTPPFYQGKPEVIALHKETKAPPSVGQRRAELVEDGKNNTVGQAVDARWQALVSACLAKDPAQRPRTAAAVLQQLSAAAPIASPSGEKKPRARLLPWAIFCGTIAIAAYAFWPQPTPPLTDERTKEGTVVQEVPPLYDGTIGNPIQLKLPGSVIMKLCYCPVGRFKMGSPSSEYGHQDDEEQVSVTIPRAFWLGQTEVTQSQWQALMGSSQSNFKGDDLPADSVSWEEAQEFINKLNSAAKLPAGWVFALPTEAEWEYACRANPQAVEPYAGEVGGMAWYSDNAGSTTHKVATKKPNAWGLYDMHGNLWEWCFDGYDSSLPGGTNPVVRAGYDRVIRGGSWIRPAGVCRSAARLWDKPGVRTYELGFRVAAFPLGSRASQ